MTVVELPKPKGWKKPDGGNKYFPSVVDIDGFFSTERNESGQFYVTQSLDGNGHYSSHTGVLFNDLYKGTFTPRRNSDGQTTIRPGIPFCHIPKTMNYANQDNSLLVINNDQLCYDDIGITSSVPFPIAKATEMITKLFENCIELAIEYDDSKRTATSVNDPSEDPCNQTECDLSSASTTTNQLEKQSIKDFGGNEKKLNVKSDTLPQVTLGWTNQACHLYADNPCTISGNVKPCLKNSKVPKCANKYIIDIVELALKLLPGDNVFNLDKLKNNQGKERRKQLFAEFKGHLGGNSNVEFFRVEGITILVPASVGWHRDTMNDSREGFQSVVSINANVKINNRTMPFGVGSYFGKWLELNGYTESFPCSVILYSRECVGGYCEKIGESERLAGKNMLNRLVKHGIVDRVCDVVDYRYQVFHNDMFCDIFRANARYPRKTENINFKGMMWARTACYDRMVRYIILLCIILILLLSVSHTFDVSCTRDCLRFSHSPTLTFM